MILTFYELLNLKNNLFSVKTLKTIGLVWPEQPVLWTFSTSPWVLLQTAATFHSPLKANISSAQIQIPSQITTQIFRSCYPFYPLGSFFAPERISVISFARKENACRFTRMWLRCKSGAGLIPAVLSFIWCKESLNYSYHLDLRIWPFRFTRRSRLGNFSCSSVIAQN